MARRSANASRSESAGNLSEEIRATRVIWNERKEPIAESFKAFTSELLLLATEMFDSPLGKRAQRHPAATLTVASLAALAILRLLRR
jgi:hypothetical protein